MKFRPSLQKIKPLLLKPRFTSSQARGLGVTSATLAHYVSQGELIRVDRGVYRGKDAPQISDPRWEELVDAVVRAKDGVVCLISALLLYEFTDEMPRKIWIAIRHGTVHTHAPNTKIVRMRNLSLGRTSVTLGNVTLSIFDRERTIVDAFRHLSIETAVKALKTALRKKGKEKLNVDRLELYAKELRVNLRPYLLALTA